MVFLPHTRAAHTQIPLASVCVRVLCQFGQNTEKRRRRKPQIEAEDGGQRVNAKMKLQAN